MTYSNVYLLGTDVPFAVELSPDDVIQRTMACLDANGTSGVFLRLPIVYWSTDAGDDPDGPDGGERSYETRTLLVRADQIASASDCGPRQEADMLDAQGVG